ncbi:MAG: hypothetical protein MUC50_10450 [Myxococcota bacterium]|jgi:hypothetical protein|nr:hypothetical protein [Myxococcota bacterium]
MRGRAHCGVEGAVYVEMLIVIWPLALLWLGLGQFGMLCAADVLVTHAAGRAVRAAIVILPDDKPGWEVRYAEEEPLTLGGTGEGLDAYASATKGDRLAAIRRAARITLSSISPQTGDSFPEIFRGYQWTEWAVAVTFPSGDSYLTEFSSTQLLTARVTYLFPCVVPVVDRLLCSPYYGLDEPSRRELDTVDGWVLGAASLGLSLRGFDVFDLSASRFVAVRAQATMPMQGRRK